MAKSKAPKSKKPAAKKATGRPAATEHQNGIPRPGADTLCAKVWEVLDKLHAKGEPATPVPVFEALKGEKIADATVRTQYGRWRKFNGLTKEASKS